MRILQIAPLAERVPPIRYGGTEAVVGLLADGLVRAGHDVILWASGDSLTLAEYMEVHLQPGPYILEDRWRDYAERLDQKLVRALEDPNVSRVVKGEGVDDAQLDENAVRRCAGLRPSDTAKMMVT